MKYLLFLALSFIALCTTAQKINPVMVKSATWYNKTIVQVKPAYKDYVTQTAKAFSHRKLNMDSLKNTMKAPGNAMFSLLNQADITTLMFLVMQATAAENEKDIKNAMAAMEQNKQKKEALRNEEQTIREAAKTAAYQDIKNNMAAMEKSRQQKESPPKVVDTSKIKTPNFTAQQAKRLAAIQKEKDALDEMNQQDQLQLQQLIDKKNQLESMISNTMKAVEETQNSISSNLKGS